ncbi:MAG: hypothetical protein UY35_C0001G0062 [Candidatus Saccharibacteria bacterium GW2011_GWC2_48_9]|nr:MAG: hypothetical protein UY35_C0001G0062 [Candidatus Saccharibacteria bacterium GW2011_GWC2_48_9]
MRIKKRRSQQDSLESVGHGPAIEPYPVAQDEPLTHEILHYHRAHEPRFNKALRSIGMSAIAATAIGIGHVYEDVHSGIEAGKAAVRDDRASIHEVYGSDNESALYSHHATFVLTGLGTKNPTETAETLRSHQDVGSVYALEYSNKDLDTADMAQQIVDQAEQDDLRYISLDGYSAGGPIALDIATHIYQHEPELHIVSIVLNSSPIGEGSLTQRSSEGIDIMNALLSVHEDFVYYERGRLITEVIARSDRYMTALEIVDHQGFRLYDISTFSINGVKYLFDLENLQKEVKDVSAKLDEPDTASGSLIKHQADFIVTTDYRRNLEILSELRPGDIALPVIVYTRAQHADNDRVVDIDASEKNFIDAVEQYGNPYAVIDGPVRHANPGELPSEYAAMIRERIQPRVIGTLVFYALRQSAGDSKVDTRARNNASSEDDFPLVSRPEN